MATATSTSVGLFSSFNHEQQEWLPYKNRIKQWFIANNIDDTNDKAGIKRRAILLSAFSENTYQLASNLALPDVLEQKSFDEVVKLLDSHFTPQRCVFAERYHFYAATQKAGETSAQWAARLRGLAAHCQFKNIDESLLDRFIMGMQSGKEREKLFSKEVSELTLAKAIELAESVRCARAAASATSASTATAAAAPGAESVFKIGGTTAYRGNKCSVCGLGSHKADKCRYASYKCKKCNKKGHLRKMCNLKYLESGEVSEDDDAPNYTSGIKKKGSMGRSFRRSPSELTHEQPVGVSQNADIKVSPPSYQEFASPIAEHKVNASNWQDKDLSAQGYHIMSYMNGHPIVNRSMTNNIALTSTARVNNVPPGQHRVIGFPQDIKIKRSASEHNDGTLDSGEQSLKRDKPLPPAFDSQYDRPSSSSYPNLNNPTAITNMPPPISVPVRAANSLLASIVSNPIVHNGVASNNSQEMMEIAADMCPEPTGKIPRSVTECYNQLVEGIEPPVVEPIHNENYTADNCNDVDNKIDQMLQRNATENTPSNNPDIPDVNYTISDIQLYSSIDDVSEDLKIMHVTN